MVSPPNRAMFAAALLLAGALVAGASPASATTLPPTSSALPGSMFQGGDGNQTDETPYADWADLQAAGRVAHVEDPNANDSVFKGGTKEDDPGDWSFVTQAGGNTPGGTNIRDAWAAVDQVGTKTFLYLASTRDSDTGTSFITFELNRDGSLWTNSDGTKVPCRREGDILITYQPQGGDENLVVQRWHTLTTDPNDSGCAETGELENAALQTNVDAQGAFNTQTITDSVLPGSLTSIGPRLFMETAIDLGKIAQDAFGDPCLTYTSIWMHSRSSTSDSSNMQDVVRPRPLEARTCAAAGTKFVDLNANGLRDPGEPGIAGAKIFADYNNNGIPDPNEPFAISDADGNYVIDDIGPGPYTLRETTVSGTNPKHLRCSYPNSAVSGYVAAPGGITACGWSVDGATEPYARGRDFGNYQPAHLIVRKQVFPAGDSTKFQVVQPGGTFTLGTGQQAGGNIDLTPGTYSASEISNPDYSSSVACRAGTAPAIAVHGTSGAITLTSGETAVCTFYNAHKAAPAVAIDKAGPATAIAGARLDYTLHVTNVGSIALAADTVNVVDQGCDSPPTRINRGNDSTPTSLDPGEVWTYVCSHLTARPTSGCTTREVANTAHVTAGTARDSSSLTTTVTCPTPKIALRKVGPESAPAGAIVRYVFFVYNTGNFAFAGRGGLVDHPDVTVTDDRCDTDPVIAARFSKTRAADASPATFDPGDVWAVTCLSTTARNGTACTPSTLTNVGAVDAVIGALSASATDSWRTSLTCAPPPPGPPPKEPLPPVPPTPPDLSFVPSLIPNVVNPTPAGAAGVAGLPPLRGCIRRGSILRLRATRAASVSFSLGNKRISGLSVQPLQSRVIVRVLRNFKPGRYTVTARVTFQRGAGTAPLRVERQVRVCGSSRQPRPPAFTG